MISAGFKALLFMIGLHPIAFAIGLTVCIVVASYLLMRNASEQIVTHINTQESHVHAAVFESKAPDQITQASQPCVRRISVLNTAPIMVE